MHAKLVLRTLMTLALATLGAHSAVWADVPSPVPTVVAPAAADALLPPAWYHPWSPVVTIKKNPLAPSPRKAAATPPRAADPAAAYRYLVPSVLKSMGTMVPDLSDTSIPASAMTLDELLAVIRQKHPEAQVVASFYDWRTVSVYRSQAGLHLGYDIAMSAGTVVPVGWPGRVVAIANWYGPEYGITVETNGYRTTYGHLSPLVKEGDIVMAGQPVGTIVRDHVDVKMRSATGDYVDFGAHATSELAALAPLPATQNPRDLGVLKFMVAQETMYQAQDRLLKERTQTRTLRSGLQSSESGIKELATQVPKMQGYYDQGLVARVDVDAAVKKYQTLQGQLKQSRELSARADERLAQAQGEVELASRQLREIQSENKKLGIGPSDVSMFLTTYVEKHPGVLKDVQRQREALRKNESAAASGPQSQELQKARERLDILERLYADGAVALKEVEEERASFARLEAASSK